MTPKARYYVLADQHRYTICEPDPDDEWSNGSYGLEVSLKGIRKTKTEGFDVAIFDESDCCYGVDDIPQGSIAYVVLVKYTTGDTFGSHDEWTIAAIKSSSAEAENAEAKCYRDPENGIYRDWDGYFEALIFADVHSFLVE